MQASREISRLLEIMAALRQPGTGCPWDVEQDFSSLAPYAIEEAYEVVDAIERGDMQDLREELGDLLLQVVFHAQMAQEHGSFDFGGIVESITAKLIRRHPHVFGDTRHLTPLAVKGLWETIKAQEKAGRRARHADAGLPVEASASILDGVPTPLPALTRALKIQQKAATVGFDWNDRRQVLAKMKEEIAEIESALDAADAGSGSHAHVVEETGDLLFAAVNLLRHLAADPEQALRGTNDKFMRRFKAIESAVAAEGKAMGGVPLAELEAYWVRAKQAEK